MKILDSRLRGNDGWLLFSSFFERKMVLTLPLQTQATREDLPDKKPAEAGFLSGKSALEGGSLQIFPQSFAHIFP
jgi:hypothetical protein